MWSHYLYQCWLIVNSTIMNKFQWNLNPNSRKCIWKCHVKWLPFLVCWLQHHHQILVWSQHHHQALFCWLQHLHQALVIGIDHDTVWAGVVGTAIRHSTSCAGRRTATCGRAGRHECCAGLQYQPRQRRPYKWSISILPRSQVYKKQGKLAFSTSCTSVCPHRCLRNDAWRRDS